MKPINELIDEIVTTIRRICKEKHITIAQMESDLGFSAGLISRWNKTKTSPSFDKIVAIMDYLDITYDELMSNTRQDKSMNNSSNQAANICKKLLEDSEHGRIEWFDACEGKPFDISFEQIFSDWENYHVHRIYYTGFGDGYFFLALQCNENTLELEADIYMIVEDGFEPRLIRDTDAYALKLLKHADNHLYMEWAQRKAEKMESNYMAF